MKTAFSLGSRAWSIATIAGLMGAGATQGALSQSVITAPGGFIQAGAYQSTNAGGHAAGHDLELFYGTGQSFQEFAFAGDSLASASAAASGPSAFGTITNSASGTAEMGRIRMMAANSSPNGASSAAGFGNGGWKETFVVSHPSLNGQGGFMVFQIRVSGTLTVAGQHTDLSGAASFSVSGFKDNIEMLVNPLFEPGSSDGVGERQRGFWRLGNAIGSATRNVETMMTMAVPMTFGQSFTLGLYGLASAGQGSQASGQAAPFNNSATADFSGDGVTWQGISSVQSGGGAVSGSTITSGTGIDWSVAFSDAGCPADFNGDTFVDPDDLSDFITCFFLDVQFPGTCVDADFNGDGFRDPDDLADFITTFFVGC